MTAAPGPGAYAVVTPGAFGGWYIENPNPRPITIEELRLTGRYRRWFGGIVERTWQIGNTTLRPGQELQVRPFRSPWFSSLLSHSLHIVAAYGSARYKLGNYRRDNLFEPRRSLTLWLHERLLN